MQWGTFSRLNPEWFASVITDAASVPEVLRKMGLTNQTNNRKAFWKKVSEIGINAEHLRVPSGKMPPRTAEHGLKLSAAKLGISLEERRRMAAENLRWCTFHKEAVPVSLFKNERQRSCNACLLAERLWNFWKLPLEWFLNKFKEQGSTCAICRMGIPPENFVVDHDHKHCERGCAKCARGLLCERCNIALGWLEILKKTPEMMDSAEKYLAKYGGCC